MTNQSDEDERREKQPKRGTVIPQKCEELPEHDGKGGDFGGVSQ